MINRINIPRGISKAAALMFVVSAALPTCIVAQESDATVLEEVVVTGYRQSLRAAQQLKRNAVGSQDSIVAEDLADFPDLNLADALQRLPGVAINREQGEGRQVSLRGLGPDFTSVHINGMEGLATSASAQDARGSITRSRAFDFNVFSADLFNQIDVKKSYEAKTDEGGIGGNVALTSARPFDYDGLTFATSAQVGENDQADGTNTKFTGIASNTWGKFGVLGSISYSERNTEEQGTNGFRWRQRNTGNAVGVSDNLDPDVRQALDDGEIFFNRGNRSSVWQNEQERLGASLSFQFKPTDNLTFSLDGLISNLTNDRDEFHLSTGGSSSTALGFIDELIIEEAADGDGFEAVFGEFSQLAIESESRQDEDETEFSQFTLTADWHVNDQLFIKALVGTSSSDFRKDSEKFYIQTQANQTVTTDFRGSLAFNPVYDFGAFDVTDSSLFSLREFDIDERDIENDFDNIKIDAEYTFENDNVLSFGISQRDFSNLDRQTRINNQGRIDGDGNPNGDDNPDNPLADNNGPTPLNQDVRNVDDLTFVFTDHNGLDYIAGDVQAALDFYGVNTDLDPSLVRADRVSFVEEETFNAYAQYDWTTEIAGARVRGNIGLRYYDTDITSSGFLDGADFTLEDNYDGFLTSVQAAWDINDDWVLRGSIAENLTRPSLGNLAVGASLSQNGGDLIVSSGNPGLEPFESTNFDLSLEWYFGDAGALALGLFYKDIDNFITTSTIDIPFSETGFELDLLIDGRDGDSIAQFTTPVNSDESTDISGVELAFQTDFTFLPAPFDKLGVQTNYTYSDGDFLFNNIQGAGADVSQRKSFVGLSKDTVNFTLYYETDVWGARISSSYRSQFLSDGDGVGTDSDESGVHSTNYVDFSSFYQLTDNFKLTLDAVNLGDEEEELFTDSADRIQHVTTSGTSVFLGVSYRL